MAACLVVAGVACSGGSVRLTPSYVAVHNAMAAMGLAQTGEISEGALGEGEVARVTASFREGVCYTVVAIGGSGARDVNVRISDDAGTELAADRNRDGQAAAQFCPARSGDYQVAVEMASGSGSYVMSTWSGVPALGAAGASGVAIAPAMRGGTCQEPIPIQTGVALRGDTRNAAATMSGSCIQGGSAPEVVYVLEVADRSQVQVVQTSRYDGALYLLSECGEPATELACNDDAGSTRESRLDVTLDPGRYYLVVDGFGDSAGTYELQVTTVGVQSLAQLCGQAASLSPGQAVTGTTVGAADSFQASCAGNAQSPERLYSLDVSTRSRVRVRMQSTHDGALYLRSSCLDPTTEVACNDDHRDTNHSMITATVAPGTYFVFADGYAGSSQGDYSMQADLAPVAGGGANADTCAAALPHALPQDLEVDTFAAADDLAGSCGGGGAPDVVYRLDVQNRIRLRLRLGDTEVESAVVYLRRRCDQAGTEVACGAFSGPQDSMEASLEPGTYYLVVDGLQPDHFGASRLELQVEDLTALERACRQAPRLRPGRTTRGDTSSSANRFQATCADNAQSNDLVYRLVLPRRQRVTLTSEQQYDGAIYIRSSCTDPGTEIACNDDASPGDNRHSTLETTLDRGTYYVFVDGFGDREQGSFELEVSLSAP
ncbi:MAG: hypothetical protein ACFCGT_12180 [Sandaracinaceae bacterium]